MKHKVFISFKTEDKTYKEYIQNNLNVDLIDKSLNEPIQSNDEDYIMRQIREKYLRDSTVTISLIGSKSAENLHPNIENQAFIKREIQASLYTNTLSSKNGILAIILPEVKEKVFPHGDETRLNGSGDHVRIVQIDNSTTIKEISSNYYLDSPLHDSSKTSWSADERYIVSVNWEDFILNPNEYIDQAFKKRTEPIAQYTKVYPQ